MEKDETEIYRLYRRNVSSKKMSEKFENETILNKYVEVYFVISILQIILIFNFRDCIRFERPS